MSGNAQRKSDSMGGLGRLRERKGKLGESSGSASTVIDSHPSRRKVKASAFRCLRLQGWQGSSLLLAHLLPCSALASESLRSFVTLWFVDRLSFKLLRKACPGFHSKSFVLEITWDVFLSLHPPARSCICLLLSSRRSFSLHVGLWVRHPRNSMCQPRGYACRAQRIEHPLPEQAGVRVGDRAALLV